MNLPIIKQFLKTVPLLLFLAAMTACSSPKGNWGSKSTLAPAWKKITSSAVAAAKDTKTWAPLAGAVLFALEDFDEKMVNWAADHNPLFGSIENAKDWSDRLADLSSANYLVTVAAADSGEGREGMVNRSRGLLLGLIATGVNDGMTNELKSALERRRPDRPSRTSFPSRHSSGAAVSATLASGNIDYSRLSREKKLYWQTTSHTVAGLTAWARVEAKRHYPTDVLAGFALGHFLGAFFNDAFISPEQQETINISALISEEGRLFLTWNRSW